MYTCLYTAILKRSAFSSSMEFHRWFYACLIYESALHIIRLSIIKTGKRTYVKLGFQPLLAYSVGHIPVSFLNIFEK